jgi:hypothetical protein
MPKDHQAKHREPEKKRLARDARYASARPWDWKVCRDCEGLISERCPTCGGNHFSKEPADILRVAIQRFGYPPALHKDT